jgi:hypothetical protein
MRKRALAFAVLIPVVSAMAGLAYLVWWETTHCLFCGKKLGPNGRCTNPECSLGRLTD